MRRRATSEMAATAHPATPETELTGLATTRRNLLARQATVVAEVEQAVATRRDLLIGNGSAADIADAEHACREVEGAAFGIADALVEVERRIAAGEARIEVASRAAEIEAAASGLERDATQIERATAGLARALAEVARARSTLADAITAPAAGQFDPHNGPAAPSEIATNLFLQGLVHVMPDIAVTAVLKPWSLYGIPVTIEPEDPTAIAAEFGDQLRHAAARVRAGEADPSSLPQGFDVAPSRKLTVLETEIHIVVPFYYHRDRTHREMVATPVTRVPAPVAERAIDSGYATTGETPDWRSFWAKDAGPAYADHRRFDWSDCADLDFDLSAWRGEQLREAA